MRISCATERNLGGLHVPHAKRWNRSDSNCDNNNNSHRLGCYLLCGFKWSMHPMAMLLHVGWPESRCIRNNVMCDKWRRSGSVQESLSGASPSCKTDREGGSDSNCEPMFPCEAIQKPKGTWLQSQCKLCQQLKHIHKDPDIIKLEIWKKTQTVHFSVSCGEWGHQPQIVALLWNQFWCCWQDLDPETCNWQSFAHDSTIQAISLIILLWIVAHDNFCIPLIVKPNFSALSVVFWVEGKDAKGKRISSTIPTQLVSLCVFLIRSISSAFAWH